MKQFFTTLAAILCAFGIITGIFYILGMDSRWHRQMEGDIEVWGQARDDWASHEDIIGLKQTALEAAQKLISDSKRNPIWSELTPAERDAISNAQGNFPDHPML